MSFTHYDETFFRGLSDGSYSGAEELLPLVFSLIKVQSVLDIGCGTGTWLAAAQAHGVMDVLGVDGAYVNPKMLRIPAAQFRPYDLTQVLELNRHFDLVISLEVAEHLPESAAETLVDNLVRHGSIILFSAAVPGQGGTFHINEQWPGYWADLFAVRGYTAVDCIRDRVWHNARIPVCYRQNAFLYVKDEVLAASEKLSLENERCKQMPTALVHPELFAEVLNRPLSTRRLLKESPSAILRTLSARARRLAGGL
jgi:SAM-dependent methyltransferase